MRSSRRFLVVLLVGLAVFGGAVIGVVERTDDAGAADQSPILTPPPQPEPVATTAVEAPPSTAPAAPAATRRPVRPPANPYAGEPIQEIGTIEIPKIGLRHKIMHGISLRNIDHGPSHWPGTALPGEAGNSVFAGHRVTHSRPFRNIDQLVEGDEVIFTVNGVRSRYLVTGHEIVAPNRLDIVQPTATPTATIFACHPPGSAKQRYVVRMALAEVG